MTMSAPVVQELKLVSHERRGSPADRRRAIGLAVVGGLFMSTVSMLLVPLGIVTLFRARRLYAFVARWTCVAVLRLYGVRIRVIPNRALATVGVRRSAFPKAQTIYVSNHTSTLDLFVLVALGLPNCRFFLSGFVRKFVPLGIISTMMGTFFTVPQDQPAERTRIFQRAERILRRTRESVYLSPEGGRITTGEIGHFNKGAFHLATHLKAPIVPFYIRIPSEVDPGRGYDARPGTVEVHVMPEIATSTWTLDRLDRNRQHVREQFLRIHEELASGRI